jgi:hypothetical protein
MSAHPARVCPVCAQGTVADIVFDEAPDTREPIQRAESRELVIYTCGHRVPGASLATADEERLDVERRSSDETVDPGPSQTSERSS